MNRGPVAGPANRRALIEAARIEFALGGAGVPLSRIAARAGVGQGSLYRHFRDRLELAHAVFDENLTQLREQVLASARPLGTFLDAVQEQASEAAVLIELVSDHRLQAQAEDIKDQLRHIVAEVHEASLVSGELREVVTPEELVTAVSMLALPIAKAASDQREVVAESARRILDAWFCGI